MYNGKLNENHLSARVRLYENLKLKSACHFYQIQIHFLKNYSLFIYSKYYVWLNALKAILPSLNIEFYGWKMGGDYNVVPEWFSENQLPPSMVNSSETDLKKKASLNQNQKSPQIISPVAKKKLRPRQNKKIQTDFSMLNYPEGSVNTYSTGVESEWGKDFSTDVTDKTHQTVIVPLKYFRGILVFKKIKLYTNKLT